MINLSIAGIKASSKSEKIYKRIKLSTIIVVEPTQCCNAIDIITKIINNQSGHNATSDGYKLPKERFALASVAKNVVDERTGPSGI